MSKTTTEAVYEVTKSMIQQLREAAEEPQIDRLRSLLDELEESVAEYEKGSLGEVVLQLRPAVHNGLGTVEVHAETDDLDWAYVPADAVLRDAGGRVFWCWIRVEQPELHGQRRQVDADKLIIGARSETPKGAN